MQYILLHAEMRAVGDRGFLYLPYTSWDASLQPVFERRTHAIIQSQEAVSTSRPIFGFWTSFFFFAFLRLRLDLDGESGCLKDC